MFIVKELIVCSLDGTCEANILGVYKTEEEAFKKLKEGAKDHISDINEFYNCNISGPKDFLNFLPNFNKRDYAINEKNNLFCVSSKDCWYEYYLEITIEEIKIQE